MLKSLAPLKYRSTAKAQEWHFKDHPHCQQTFVHMMTNVIATAHTTCEMLTFCGKCPYTCRYTLDKRNNIWSDPEDGFKVPVPSGDRVHPPPARLVGEASGFVPQPPPLPGQPGQGDFDNAPPPPPPRSASAFSVPFPLVTGELCFSHSGFQLSVGALLQRWLCPPDCCPRRAVAAPRFRLRLMLYRSRRRLVGMRAHPLH